MNHSTATVVTLTAAVRVLQVGSRQITLSVAKQLDRVPREELDPMGRVRIGPWHGLIGSRYTDETLVTADFWTPTPLNVKVRVCNHYKSGDLLFLGRKPFIPKDFAWNGYPLRCSHDDGQAQWEEESLHGRPKVADALAGFSEAQLMEYTLRCQMDRTEPLIVLAGLR